MLCDIKHFTISQLKLPNLDCLLCCNVYKQAFIKAFTFKHGLNRGIHVSPSEMNMQNSVLPALLARIRLIKECMIYSYSYVPSCHLYNICMATCMQNL